jgi:hypothetical protein
MWAARRLSFASGVCVPVTSILKIVADIVRVVWASLRTNEAKPKDAGRGAPVEVRKGAVPSGGGS